LIPDQADLIHNTDWHALIILDACRYDCFENQYQKYLKGKLIKVASAGSHTKQWLPRTWPDWYDLIYISAIPYINSVGYRVRGFSAVEHFREIIDVWNFGYDETIGWTPPRAVNNAVLEIAGKDRMIIHYGQPHGPYIGRTKIFTRPSMFRFRDELLGIPHNPISLFPAREPQTKTREERQQAMFNAYKETLDLVLEKVAEILPALDGLVIVTSDHGELMGERGRWGGHIRGWDIPALRHVPWLEVDE